MIELQLQYPLSKRMSQCRENSGIHAMRDGTYCCRPIIPLLNSVPLHLSHVVGFDADPTNRSINNLLPPRIEVQMLVLSL